MMIELSPEFAQAWERGMMSHAQYSWISRAIAGRSALVFGAGYDSALWHRLSATIAESNPSWVGDGIVPIDVPGRVNRWVAESPPPPAISSGYDCVLVDAPTGYDLHQPGRQLTIYWASLLAREFVFVHDYQRPWERACCDRYLGQPAAVITARKGHLAIFPRAVPAPSLPPLQTEIITEQHLGHLGERYRGIMGRASFPPITAWSHSLAWLELHPQLWESHGVMLVEDDCWASLDHITQLFTASVHAGAALGASWIGNKNQCKRWVWHWSTHLGDAPDLWKSYNPICYLSPMLLREVFAHRQARGRYAFHEILFATLAARAGGGLLMDWQLTHAGLFGAYRYRPCVKSHELAHGICHPVKSQITRPRHMSIYHPAIA